MQKCCRDYAVLLNIFELLNIQFIEIQSSRIAF